MTVSKQLRAMLFKMLALFSPIKTNALFSLIMESISQANFSKNRSVCLAFTNWQVSKGIDFYELKSQILLESSQ